ncbi:hypothetical protein GCM10027341_31770 [Spirosoma knui]
MNYLLSSLRKNLLVSMLAVSALTACSDSSTPTPAPVAPQPAATAEPNWIKQPLTLPTLVEYKASEGYFSNQTFRSTFTYDEQNRLVAITQKFSDPQEPNPQFQFEYTELGLRRILLPPALITDRLTVPDANNAKWASFELNYQNQTLQAKLFLDSKEQKTVSIELDQRGFPIKEKLAGLYFDAAGNVDWVARSRQENTLNPQLRSQVTEQRYDTHKPVFSHVREIQLLEALLSTLRETIPTSGLIGLGTSLNNNNLLYLKQRNCTSDNKCQDSVLEQNQVLSVNESGFPTQLHYSLGAFGYYDYKVTYKQVN